MRIVGLAIVTTSGPSTVKPIAKAAFRVSVKIPLAAVSWPGGTTSGIIESSAGAKKVVAIETAMFSTKTTAMFVSSRASAMKRPARRRFVTTRTIRRSKRST